MIRILETFKVDRPLEVVWPLLSDLEVVVICMPGAQLVADRGDGEYEGTCSVKFGPIRAVFRGVAKISFDHVAHSCSIEARGQDQKGASRGNANAVIRASDDHGTTAVSIDGSFVVNGPLGQFARTGGQHLAREIIAQFARNFEAHLGSSAGSEMATKEVAGESLECDASMNARKRDSAVSRNQLSAFGLVWRVIKNMIVGRLGAKR